MILEYYRPTTIESALQLLSRSAPPTYPLGGGTFLHSLAAEQDFAVVDLQSLKLDAIRAAGDTVIIGATACLQAIAENEAIPPTLKAAIQEETGYNRRQIATLGGWITACDGRSLINGLLLAADCSITCRAGCTHVGMGDYLLSRAFPHPFQLITEIQMSRGWTLTFEKITRSPADRPVVFAAVGKLLNSRAGPCLSGQP